MNAMEMMSGLPKTMLVGTGVVGRAILQAHLTAGVSVCVTDQDTDLLESAIQDTAASISNASVTFERIDEAGMSLAIVDFDNNSKRDETQRDGVPRIVIESIAERLDVKQAFFATAERWFGDDTILCSNTSTLQIQSIAVGLQRPERLCGMHFFMPVVNRPAVEVVRSKQTDDSIIQRCNEHVKRIGKSPLVVADCPGFIVNRLLSPYLNQALLLLTRGISADRIELAAIKYGMPLSPLELIDYIGTRTMFHAGRSFWQAFPTRIDPSLIIPRLVKKQLLGRHDGLGLYAYQDGKRSETLSEPAEQIVAEYAADPLPLTDRDIIDLLAIPMWIEAALAYRDGVSENLSDFNLAMQGGLGYEHPNGWLGFFDDLETQTIQIAIQRWGVEFKSMQAPRSLIQLLQTSTASQAIQRWRQVK